MMSGFTVVRDDVVKAMVAQRVSERAQSIRRRAGQGEKLRGRTRRSPGDSEGASRANRKSERAASDAATADEPGSY
jgi:hypothetical protein